MSSHMHSSWNWPWTERLKSIPEMFGIRLHEEPYYQLLKQDRPFEIRRYPRHARAKITLTDISFDDFRAIAFKALSAYIFGAHKQKEETMAMISPVIEERDGSEGWTMSFLLPVKYGSQKAPEPLNPHIQIEEVPPQVVGVVTYSGSSDLDKMKLHENELAEWLRNQDSFQSTGKYSLAQYDAPFVIPFMRKNEIHVEVLQVGTSGQLGRPNKLN